MLTANDITDGGISFSTARHTSQHAYEELTAKSRPTRGDILVTKDGTLGRVAVADGPDLCINQSIAILRSNHRLGTVDFLQNALRAHLYQRRMIFEAGGTTIKHIYISRLAKMPVAFPPLKEQKLISDRVQLVRNDLDSAVQRIRHTISLLREYGTRLTADVVTGKVDVRGTDLLVKEDDELEHLESFEEIALDEMDGF